MAAMGFTSNGYLGAAWFAVEGFGVMLWNVITMSLRQALIPHELFGRVQGAYRTVVWGSIPVGSLLGGLLARAVGLSAVFVVAGAGLLIMAVALGRLGRRPSHRTGGAPRAGDGVGQLRQCSRTAAALSTGRSHQNR